MLQWFVSLPEVTMQPKAFLVATLLLSSASLSAQKSFTAAWEQRATRTQSLQPAWPAIRN